MPAVPEEMFVRGVTEAVERNREFVPPYGASRPPVCVLPVLPIFAVRFSPSLFFFAVRFFRFLLSGSSKPPPHLLFGAHARR